MTDQPTLDRCGDIEALGHKIETLGKVIGTCREAFPESVLNSICEVHRLTAPSDPDGPNPISAPCRSNDDPQYRACRATLAQLSGFDGPAPDPTRPSEAGMISRPTDKDLGDRIDHVWTELIDLMSGMSDRLIDLERKARHDPPPTDPDAQMSIDTLNEAGRAFEARPRVHRATGG